MIYSPEEAKRLFDKAAQRRNERAILPKQSTLGIFVRKVIVPTCLLMLGMGIGAVRMRGGAGQVISLLLSGVCGILMGYVTWAVFFIQQARKDPSLPFAILYGIQSKTDGQSEKEGCTPECALCHRYLGTPQSEHDECPLCLADLPPEHPLWAAMVDGRGEPVSPAGRQFEETTIPPDEVP